MPARSAATLHLFVMVTATLLFAATWLAQRPGYNADEPSDRVSLILLITGRALLLLLVFTLSALVLVASVGALIKGVELHGAVYVFCVLDLLLATLIVLTFGRSERRPARRRANPAGR